MKDANIQTVLLFIRAINAHNAAKLYELMSEDHLFVDALGNMVKGREQMRAAWEAYFGMIPDYEIVCEDILRNGEIVAVFGIARGIYAIGGQLLEENRWEIPAAWKAVVRKARIAEWRVYADNEPLRRIMKSCG